MTRPRQKRTMNTVNRYQLIDSLDILTMSTISGYVYFYEDRVSLAIAFNFSDVFDRAAIGLVEKGMDKRMMLSAIRFDPILIARYYSINRSVPFGLGGDCQVIIDYMTGHVDQDKLNIVMVAIDRFKGPKLLVEKADKRPYRIGNQVAQQYYHAIREYTFDPSLRDIVDDIGLDLMDSAPYEIAEYLSCIPDGHYPYILEVGNKTKMIGCGGCITERYLMYSRHRNSACDLRMEFYDDMSIRKALQRFMPAGFKVL